MSCIYFQLNVDPSQLLPELTNPKDLQPFPTTLAFVGGYEYILLIIVHFEVYARTFWPSSGIVHGA